MAFLMWEWLCKEAKIYTFNLELITCEAYNKSAEKFHGVIVVWKDGGSDPGGDAYEDRSEISVEGGEFLTAFEIVQTFVSLASLLVSVTTLCFMIFKQEDKK